MSQVATAFGTKFRSKVRGYATQQWSSVKLLRFARDWVPASVGRIAEYGQLSRNWDSYESNPISEEATEKALRFLAEGPIELIPEPSISPVPGGGLGFHWRVDSRDLELEFHPDGALTFLKTVRAKGCGAEVDEGEIQNLSDTKLWLWLSGE